MNFIKVGSTFVALDMITSYSELKKSWFQEFPEVSYWSLVDVVGGGSIRVSFGLVYAGVAGAYKILENRFGLVKLEGDQNLENLGKDIGALSQEDKEVVGKELKKMESQLEQEAKIKFDVFVSTLERHKRDIQVLNLGGV